MIDARFPQHKRCYPPGRYTPPQLLTDELGNEERNSVVIRAIRTHAITLMTRYVSVLVPIRGVPSQTHPTERVCVCLHCLAL